MSEDWLLGEGESAGKAVHRFVCGKGGFIWGSAWEVLLMKTVPILLRRCAVRFLLVGVFVGDVQWKWLFVKSVMRLRSHAIGWRKRGVLACLTSRRRA